MDNRSVPIPIKHTMLKSRNLGRLDNYNEVHQCPYCGAYVGVSYVYKGNIATCPRCTNNFFRGEYRVIFPPFTGSSNA